MISIGTIYVVHEIKSPSKSPWFFPVGRLDPDPDPAQARSPRSPSPPTQSCGPEPLTEPLGEEAGALRGRHIHFIVI